MKLKVLSASLIALVFLVPACKGAEIHRSFTTIVNEAALVFVGTVASQTPHPGEPGKMVFTDVTFSDIEIVSGKPAAEMVSDGSLTLSFAGGEWGGEIMKVSGVPEFVNQRRYLVFVKYMVPKVASPVVGSSQGVFPLIQDEATGEWYALTYGGRAITSLQEDGELAVTPRVEKIVNARAVYLPTDTTDITTVLPERVAGSPSPNSRVSIMEPNLAKSQQPLTLKQLLKTVEALATTKGEQQ